MEGLLSLLFFAGFFYLMMRVGCGAHASGGAHQAASNGVDVDHVDPVCSMKVDMSAGYGKMHDGRLHRFCSRACLDKFDANPAQYLGTRAGAGRLTT